MIEGGIADHILAAVSDAPQTGRGLRSFAMDLVSKLDGYDWSGIYRLEGDELVLDAYVGAETDHTRIPVGRGVCGTAVAENKNQIIDDVRHLDNYLACSLDTRSEIVVLIHRHGQIVGQIDVDGHQTGAFDRTDEEFLKALGEILSQKWD
jgi:GAF domain-containing protein